MKLNYNLLKEILEYVEDKGTGFTEHYFAEKDFENSPEGKEKFIAHVYHYNILIENELIDGRSIIHPTFSPANPTAVIYYKDLTIAGQQVLEGMRDEETSGKIKDTLIKGGKGTLEQIPALAVGVIMKLVGLW